VRSAVFSIIAACQSGKCRFWRRLAFPSVSANGYLEILLDFHLAQTVVLVGRRNYLAENRLLFLLLSLAAQGCPLIYAEQLAHNAIPDKVN
jgi:hypothetical protein